MKFNNSFSSILTKIIIFSALLGIIVYFIYPALSASQGDSAQLAALLAAAASIISVLLTSIEIEASSDTNGKSGGGEPLSIFVGNLAYKASRDELKALFGKYGEVRSVRIMTDRATRRPRGFGFIEMDEKSARKAIKKLDGYEFMGRNIKVNEGNQRRQQQDG